MGQPRAKTDKNTGQIQETVIPMRLYVGLIFIVIGLILCLFTK